MSDPHDSLRLADLVASRYIVKLLIDPAAGRFLDVSQAAADFYGRSREALRQLSAWDLTPLRNRADTLALLAEIASGLDLGVCPGSRLRQHGGELREVMVYPDLVEHDGRVLILATVTDVTELRQTEARLRRSEEQFRALVETTSDCVWPDGDDRGLRGITRDITERLRRDTALVAAREAAARHASEQRLGALVEQGLAGVAEADLDGQLTHAADGTPRRMDGVVQDITERKALGQALERERAHLEDLVAARTAELKTLAERIQLANEAAGIGIMGMGPGHRLPGLICPTLRNVTGSSPTSGSWRPAMSSWSSGCGPRPGTIAGS